MIRLIDASIICNIPQPIYVQIYARKGLKPASIKHDHHSATIWRYTVQPWYHYLEKPLILRNYQNIENIYILKSEFRGCLETQQKWMVFTKNSCEHWNKWEMYASIMRIIKQ